MGFSSPQGSGSGGGGGASQLTDLSDVAAKTGSGTTVVMQGSPTITTPTIASFTNSTHNHEDGAGGGQLDLTAAVTGTLPVANGGTGTTVGVFPEFQFYADQMENPVNADWTVNALAPASADSNNNGLTVRLFDDTTEEGIGFTIHIPSSATNIVLDFVSRAETAPGGAVTVKTKLYNRDAPDNAAVSSWSAGTALTDLSMPANENFQYDTQTIALSTLGVTAGETTQFELTRLGTGTLSGDWALLLLKISFT